jgi:putative ABC transport system permease protein
MNVKSAEMKTRSLTGMGAVATLALAVLVFGCVLVATAGPREGLYTRTRALQHVLAAVPALARSITVSTSWSQMIDSVAHPRTSFSEGVLINATSQFNRVFSGCPIVGACVPSSVLHLAPVSADWLGMTTTEEGVDSALADTGGHPVEMEVSYRLPLTDHVRVLTGSLSAPAPAASRQIVGFFPTINVAVTRRTADKFGLRVGSAVQTAGPPMSQSGAVSSITLKVTAIVAESQPNSAFWQADPSLAVPELNVPGTSPPYWTAGVFALPDESAAVQQDYGPGLLNVQWVLPVNVGMLQGNQAQPLDAALKRAVTETPQLLGPLGGVAVTVSSGLLQVVDSFVYNAAAVDALLWLLYVSLAVIAAIVLLLAARMMVLRRASELALRRARGATLWQIGLAAGRGAAMGCVPAAVLAGALAVLLVPGPAPPGGWWPGIAVLVIAIGTPAVLGVWQQRTARTRRGRAAGGYTRPGQIGPSQPSLGYGGLGYSRRTGRRRFGGGVRWVVEATAVLASIAGIVVFRQQGTQPGTAVNLYTSAAPVLVAIPAVIVALRIYPLVLRGLLRGAARGRGATGFLGMAQAARAALTPSLPAYALVLAITAAAFAGMVRDAVTRGEINASWQAAGADVTVSAIGSPQGLPAAAQHALAAVRGVEHAAVVSEWTLTPPQGAAVTAIAVDPASYSALVASSPTWPAVDPRLLTADRVLASPLAMKAFGGHQTVTLNFGTPIRVRVAGTLSGTPALPAGGPFVVMPDSLLAHLRYVVPNLMLLNGPRIDIATITALVNKMVPVPTTTVRSGLLRQLTSAPVQRSAFPLFALALAVAAGLGLAVMLLQLALGAADREATLARLATMGFGGGRRARLVVLEALPAVIAAAVAAIAAALVLPRIVAPAINLSVFTGSGTRVPLVPDVQSIAWPIIGLIVVAAVTLTIEIRVRRSVVSTLRGGE